MANKAVVGVKVGMTQVWDEDNRVLPVTVLRVTPNRVVQIKTTERDCYTALQVTFGNRDAAKLNRPEAGHFAAGGAPSWLFFARPPPSALAAPRSASASRSPPVRAPPGWSAPRAPLRPPPPAASAPLRPAARAPPLPPATPPPQPPPLTRQKAVEDVTVPQALFFFAPHCNSRVVTLTLESTNLLQLAS